jgi:hypothetical protein
MPVHPPGLTAATGGGGGSADFFLHVQTKRAGKIERIKNKKNINKLRK